MFFETRLATNHPILLDWARVKFALKHHATATQHALDLEQKLATAERERTEWMEIAQQGESLMIETTNSLKRAIVSRQDIEAERDSALSSLAALREENERLKEKLKTANEELDWQNHRNSGHPTKGGYEFYINEEWTGLATAALDIDAGWQAALRKHRLDPDDERVRIRRVAEDDTIIRESDSLRTQLSSALATIEELRKDGERLDKVEQLKDRIFAIWYDRTDTTEPVMRWTITGNPTDGCSGGEPISEGSTLRSAIDAAVTGEKPE